MNCYRCVLHSIYQICLNHYSLSTFLVQTNAPSSLTMDEHLNSVKNEIGEKWRDSCNAIYLEGKPIGVSIPHIETGKKMKEGYFILEFYLRREGRDIVHLFTTSQCIY